MGPIPVKDFPDVESKGYDTKTLTKKARAWEEILTRFNSQIPYGIKRDLSQLQGCWRRLKLQSNKEHDLHRRETKQIDGGKAPASPSEVRKLLADVLSDYVNPLEQEFDDDAGGELDLRCDKDEREVITCEVDLSLLDRLEAIGTKGAEKVRKKEDNQKYCNHHKFQKKRIKGLIKLIALHVFICFLILLSINPTCNLIQSLILLSKVS